jgi:hypothetical protein
VHSRYPGIGEKHGLLLSQCNEHFGLTLSASSCTLPCFRDGGGPLVQIDFFARRIKAAPALR